MSNSHGGAPATSVSEAAAAPIFSVAPWPSPGPTSCKVSEAHAVTLGFPASEPASGRGNRCRWLPANSDDCRAREDWGNVLRALALLGHIQVRYVCQMAGMKWHAENWARLQHGMTPVWRILLAIREIMARDPDPLTTIDLAIQMAAYHYGREA